MKQQLSGVAGFPWPDGRTSAAAFTFDLDAEAVWEGEDPANADRPGVLSQGSYGPKVAVPLILALLARHDVTATFFVPGANVERHHAVVERILAAGHELAVHGYTHTSPARLTPEAEAAELDRSLELLRGLGAEVTGYRSPSWDVSPVTLDLLDARGIRYASQFMDDLVPYRHPGRRVLELPVQWILDDAPHFWFSGADWSRTIRSVGEVEPIWSEELDGYRSLGGVFILTMHPQVIGRPSRLVLLERMLVRAVQAPDVWVATCAEIAAHADGILP
ncbi:MAG: polysaccharide deacetylase [Chloroflexi bacterium]|nr:polysaccharide deacetylase [Chloroflexota bacterium]